MSVARSKVARLRLSLLVGNLFLVLICPKVITAQTGGSESSKNTIFGTVVNAVTRAPVPRALVTSPDNRYAMFSDGSGHFEFNLEKEADASRKVYVGGMLASDESQGQFWLTARKPGFLDT